MLCQRHLQLLATLGALAVPAIAFAIEIKGTVATVKDGVATIDNTSDHVPHVGDAVKFVEPIEGVAEGWVADGKVSEVTGGKIKIKIGEASGTVAVGHLARINSPNARRRQANQPPATPSEDSALADEHRRRGNVLYKKGKYGEAADAHREAIRLDPQNGRHYSNLCVALVKQEKYAEAEHECRTAVRLAPNDAQFHGNLGYVLYRQRKYKEAEAEYREAIRLKPDEGEHHFDLAGTLRRQKRHAEAEKSARRAVAPVSDRALFQNELATSLYWQGRYAESAAVYRVAIRLKPDEGKYHANLAGALVKQGERQEALEPVRKAKSLGLKKHWVFKNLRLDSGRKGAEEGSLSRPNVGPPIDGEPTGPRAGTSSAQEPILPNVGPPLGDRDGRALDIRRPAASPSPGPSANVGESDSPSPSPSSGFGMETARPGEVASKFYPTDTDDPSYPMTRGSDPYAALRSRGPSKREKTLEYYRAEVRRDPHAGVTHYELGNELWATGQRREAEVAYREAVKREPNIGQFHHVLGFALGRRGDWKEAEACFRKALELYKNWEDRDPIFRASLAEALYRQGKRSEARRYAQEALDYGERSHSIYKTLNMTLPPVEDDPDDGGGFTPG